MLKITDKLYGWANERCKTACIRAENKYHTSNDAGWVGWRLEKRLLNTPRHSRWPPPHPNSSAFQLGWYNRQPSLCNVPNEGLHWSDVLLIGAMWARVGRPLTVLIRTCRTICLGRINLTCRKPEHVVFAASNSVLRRKTTQTELLSALRDYFENSWPEKFWISIENYLFIKS